MNIRLSLNEFSAPAHLKNEIENSIEQLFSSFSSRITRTFQSMPFAQMLAENEIKHLTSMIQNRCYMKIHHQSFVQSYDIPKAPSSTMETSKFIVTQSELFSSSPDVFKKMSVAKGFIELRTGDIALQEVRRFNFLRYFSFGAFVGSYYCCSDDNEWIARRCD